MRVLVTRPQPQASQWMQRLRADGVDAHALPLLQIGAEPMHALASAWQALPPWLVFVSPNAVEHFFAARPAGCDWPAEVRAAAPGPGTAEALRRAGVPAAQVIEPEASSERFDSEALWQRLRHQRWAGRRVLVVRGDGGRDWLATTLREAGAQVTFLQAYSRHAPRLNEQQRLLLADAVAQPQAHLWLFSSSEALGHLPALAPEAQWQQARALASHPRIADSARALGFGHVQTVSPAFDAVRAALAAEATKGVNTIRAP
jgi:uroporphyrinogen-III synthase